MFRKASKKFLNMALRLARAKLVHTRITLTPFTTLYFFVALFSCIVLVILQGATYADNSAAVRILDSILDSSNVARDLAIFSNGALKVCSHLPKDTEADCVVIAGSNFNSRRGLVSPTESLSPALASSDKLFRLSRARRDNSNHNVSESHHDHKHDSNAHTDDDGGSDDEDRAEHKNDENSGNAGTGEGDSEGSDIPGDNSNEEQSSAESANVEIGLSQNCILSLSWLEDILYDAKREDVVTLTFHFWLFSLSVVTILNESLPHLGAVLLAHILSAGWASFRVQSSEKLANVYRGTIVPGPCGGIDHLQNWWEMRRMHAIPILAMNVVTLLVIAFVSFKLFKVYATRTFSRVGASLEVHKVYKLVLYFSVGLQLSAFFTLASTSLWIDKICRGVLKSFADHKKLYLAAFIIILLLQLPWLVMGWVCVRRECNIRFFVFCGISVFIISISTLLFFSPLYRFIFGSWPFFATITVTAYILMVLTSSLGIFCRLNFGRGLAHYLQVNEVLEGVDFTPVLFSEDKQEIDPEKLVAEVETRVIALTNLPSAYRPSRKDRGSSIYSEINGVPIHMTSTPRLLSDLAPKSGHTSLTSVWTSRSRRVSDLIQPSSRGIRGSGKAHDDSAWASRPVAQAAPRGLPDNPRPAQSKPAIISERKS
ncbi:hypothetical protein BDQ17DRAFT_1372156 [Cyathus striatus]|nr:hypothetical protein BDQ17DRAFT_1372156 [Cyathus striatus]